MMFDPPNISQYSNEETLVLPQELTIEIIDLTLQDTPARRVQM